MMLSSEAELEKHPSRFSIQGRSPRWRAHSLADREFALYCFNAWVSSGWVSLLKEVPKPYGPEDAKTSRAVEE